jgi:putative addiction module component (TIGR02574 family)
MSLAEILNEIPKLTFVERQALVQRAMAIDDGDLTPEETALLDARMKDFHRDPEAGIPLEQLKDRVRERLPKQ